MKENERKSGCKRWIIPAVLALPVILILMLVLIRYGGTVKDLIQIAVKMAVVS